MASLSPSELLVQLQTLTKDSLHTLDNDPALRAQLCLAAKDAYLTLEQPPDVIARVFLSQVGFPFSTGL